MAKQIEYPADTVDADGKVWETVGENIRNGSNGSKSNITEYVRNEINTVLNLMFPVGYVFIGELPPYLSSIFKWKPASISTLGINSAVYLTGYVELNTKIEENKSFSIPILRSDDLTTFNTATGLNVPQGCIRVPYFVRVA